MMHWGSNPFWFMDGRCCIHIGDVLERLRDMPDESVDQVVTSPPYWGLRNYGTAFWLGGDSDCDHEPVATTRTAWANRVKGPTHAGKHGWNDARPTKEVRGHCARCGARRFDYQIGLEPTLGEHIDVLVEVFAEVWRVLKPHGSVWLNYGDCYAAAPNGRSADATKAKGDDDRTFRDKPMSTVGPIYDPNWATARGVFFAADVGSGTAGTRRIDHGDRVVAGGYLKEKDLCMIPNRLAIALQEWGWWVRSEIIWGKENAMPDSSGNQRPSTAHEKIFLLTKSADADVWRARDTGELSMNPDLTERCAYVSKRDPETGELVEGAPRWIRLGSWYDASAVMQPSSPNTHPRLSQNIEAQAGSARAHAGAKANGPMKAVSSKIAARGHRNNHSYNAAMMSRDAEKVRGLTPRHEGEINHTGLDQLGRGTGRLLRNFEDAPVVVWKIATKGYKEAHFATFPPQLVAMAIAAGSPPMGGVVLDPFGGSGTTALVALQMGRRAHLIELKPDYATMARKRIEREFMGEEERKVAEAKDREAAGEDPLANLPLFNEAAE